jgi:hypothetical protein
MPDSARLSELVHRWRDLAHTGHPREVKNRIGWAEHIKRVAAEHEDREQEQEPARRARA